MKQKISIVLILSILISILTINTAFAETDLEVHINSTEFCSYLVAGDTLFAYKKDGSLYERTGTGFTDADFTYIGSNFCSTKNEMGTPIFYDGKIIANSISGRGKSYDIATGNITDITFTNYDVNGSIYLLGVIGNKAYYMKKLSDQYLIELDLDTYEYTNLGMFDCPADMRAITPYYSNNNKLFVTFKKGSGTIKLGIFDIINKTYTDIYDTTVPWTQAPLVGANGAYIGNNTIITYIQYTSETGSFIKINTVDNNITEIPTQSLNFNRLDSYPIIGYVSYFDDKILYIRDGEAYYISLESLDLDPDEGEGEEENKDEGEEENKDETGEQGDQQGGQTNKIYLKKGNNKIDKYKVNAVKAGEKDIGTYLTLYKKVLEDVDNNTKTNKTLQIIINFLNKLFN